MGLMLDKGVKRLVVVDYDNRLLGMVDRDNVMKALAETYPGD